MSIVVEQARFAQLRQIADIYHHYVRTTAYTFDVDTKPEAWWQAWFSRFDSGSSHRLFVARDGRGVVGYACSAAYRDRAAYASSVLTSIYVAPSATRTGIGTALYRSLFEAIDRTQIHRSYAAIAMPNPASIRLHENVGFERVGYFSEQGWKFGRYWDVAWYERLPLGRRAHQRRGGLMVRGNVG
jgi:phosphinothricin acetyltransferase